jgi:hypothetical protein
VIVDKSTCNMVQDTFDMLLLETSRATPDALRRLPDNVGGLSARRLTLYRVYSEG